MTTAGYGQFYSSGLGFRAGLQWTSSVATVEHAFGLPLSVVWRSPSRTPSERVYSGAAGAMRGYGYSSLDGAVGSLLAGFLMNLFSDIEFYGGVTPGWIAGTPAPGSKTNVRTPFTLTLDAGMCINYSIWRFDIKLMPAFHFDPIGCNSAVSGHRMTPFRAREAKFQGSGHTGALFCARRPLLQFRQELRKFVNYMRAYMRAGAEARRKHGSTGCKNKDRRTPGDPPGEQQALLC